MNWAIPLAALIAVVGGVVSYWIQKSWDRREAVRAERRVKYGEYIRARYERFTRLVSIETDEFRKDDSLYVSTRDEIRITAPDRVAIALDEHAGAFNALWRCKANLVLKGDWPAEDEVMRLTKNEREKFDDLLNEMRQDTRAWDKHKLIWIAPPDIQENGLAFPIERESGPSKSIDD